MRALPPSCSPVLVSSDGHLIWKFEKRNLRVHRFDDDDDKLTGETEERFDSYLRGIIDLKEGFATFILWKCHYMYYLCI